VFERVIKIKNLSFLFLLNNKLVEKDNFIK